MASPSSPSHDQCKFDVFLSFRGEDTRHSITSHLYSALDRHKIQTFIDNRLQRGQTISSELLKAIQESKVSVIIFSKDYASSKWCLDELVEIIECKNTNGQIVVPVFYRVDPSDVRKQSGSFEVAFAKHEDEFKEKNVEKVQRWRAALKEAATISGWDSEVIRSESSLVDEIVTFVLEKLNHMSSSEFEGLVGIESRIERLNSFLCIGSVNDVRILGLWGVGGIGKTTIAGAFFNRFSTQFEASCFLENVREESENRRLVLLREVFLSKILEDKNLYIGTPHIGSTFIKDRFNRMRVLVVFDDVSHSSQLEYLVGGPILRRFGLGSRIIVTSRDKQVLKTCEADHIEEVEGLKEGEDLHLFCQHAFKQKYCPTKYLALSSRVVRYARGNPLALKVLGSSLFGKSEREWESKLEVLEKIGDRDIEKVLKTSYDELNVEQKDIFLYIACYFECRWTSRDDVTEILDACGYSIEDGISVLIDKAIITLSNEVVFIPDVPRMHDLLTDLGRHIVREESITEPGKRRMLWNDEDIHHILEDNTGTETIEAIFLNMSTSRKVHGHPKAFDKMCNLKLLKFCDHFEGSNKMQFSQGLESLPNQLRCLHWEGYPLKSLPSKFNPEKLVELYMPYSCVEKLWTGVQPLINLKRINLNESKHLKEMPDLSRAQNLRHLDLFGCSKITKFPKISGKIRYLNLGGTAIEEVPSSIESLSQLCYLNLNNCIKLKSLPTSIKLKSLSCLILDGCSKLENFPKILEPTKCFLGFKLQGTGIKELPSSVEHLINLKEMDLTDCKNLVSLPNTICNLKSLHSLTLRGCKRLQSLPELPSNLHFLDAHDCTSLETVSCNDMHRLEVLRFSNCIKLDQDARNKIVAAAQLRFQNIPPITRIDAMEGTRQSIRFFYPGSEFPVSSCSHPSQCEGSSLTIASDGKFVSVAVGANIAFDLDYQEYNTSLLTICCRCRLKYNNGRQRSFSSEFFLPQRGYVVSDHVLLWYDERFRGNITEASCEIRLWNVSEYILYGFKVKKWGVFISYAQEKEEEEEQMVFKEYDDDDCTTPLRRKMNKRQ